MEEYVCPSGRVLLKCGDTFFKATVLLVRHGLTRSSHGRGENSSQPWEEATTAVVTQQYRSFKVTRNGRYTNYIKD